MKHLSLLRIYLRAYLNVDRRYIHNTGNEKIPITLTMTLYKTDTLQESSDAGSIHEIGSSTVVQEVTFDGPSDQWIEMNLIEAGRELWPKIKNSTYVKITVQTSMECNDSLDSSPFRFVNPAEIPLENTKERERSIATSQPFLLVMAGDDTRTNHTTSHKDNNRSKRTTENECQKQDYMITFSEIQLNNVFLPLSLNIGKCTGLCSEDILRENSDLGTNHARTMSSIKAIQEYQPSHGDIVAPSGPANAPCCVPKSFEPRTSLYIEGDDGTLSMHYFNDLMIQSCGCL